MEHRGTYRQLKRKKHEHGNDRCTRHARHAMAEKAPQGREEKLYAPEASEACDSLGSCRACRLAARCMYSSVVSSLDQEF